jgi:hypothetical protein
MDNVAQRRGPHHEDRVHAADSGQWPGETP